ncbi:DUF397 domain-containing protein [Streptomyces sp. XY431]|uniref:DUF397 domain-containing protein n=1 Tax=Streptomyces sp. XY431 TaxID=1415562 RepID=UPI00336C0163
MSAYDAISTQTIFPTPSRGQQPQRWESNLTSTRPRPDSSSPDAALSTGPRLPGHPHSGDSKDPHGPTLAFTATAWASFLTALRAGELPAG